MKKINNYEIKNQAGSDTAELLLYGIIGDYWDEMDAKDIVEDLRALDVKKIIVRIYSDGGSVFAGLAIYNALKTHPADITIVIDSLAASIASVIAMAGTVQMPENAFMMIHNPAGGAWGESGTMKKMAEILDKIKESLVGVYMAKTGLDAEKIAAMMDDETWLSAKDALDLGFCDQVTGLATTNVENLKKVFNQMSNLKNVPARLMAMVQDINSNNPPNPGGKEKVMDKITLELIKEKHPDIAKALMAEGAKAAKDEYVKTGAEAERARIQAVASCTMPGHEALINKLMYDGTTSGGDAALAIVAAEKQVRVTNLQNLKTDAVDPVDPVLPAAPVKPVKKKNPVRRSLMRIQNWQKNLVILKHILLSEKLLQNAR